MVFLPMPRGGRVDDPEQGHVVPRVVDQPQIGQDVLDLLALEELEPVDHLVGHGLLAEGQLQRPGQGVDAVEDGEIPGTAPAGEDLRGDPRGDALGLVLLRGVGGQPHGHPLAVLREEALLLALDVVGDQLGGHAQDPLGAAVVLLQPHHADGGKILLELEDVVQIGPPPAVDRLVGVAGDRQVGMVDREGPGHGVLGQVRVLVFVDQDEAVSLVQLGADLGIVAEQGHHVEQEIVEIGGVGPRQLGLIGRIDPLDEGAQRVARPRLVLLGTDQLVLGPTDRRCRSPPG